MIMTVDVATSNVTPISETIQHADKLLQTHEASLKDSVVVITSVIDSLTSYRSDNVYKEIDDKINTDFNVTEDDIPRKRQRKTNTTLKEYLVCNKIGERSEDVDQNEKHFRARERIFYETLDENDKLPIAVTSVEEENIDLKEVKFFQTLDIKLLSSEEITMVNRCIQTQKRGNPDLAAFDIIFQQRTAFAEMYNLLATARAFGCSTATCDSTFSAMTRINNPQRLYVPSTNVKFDRSCPRTKLYKGLKKFNQQKNRRLQLF